MRADELEHGQAAVVADDGLAVDNAGADRQGLDGFCDDREKVREVMAVARDQANAPPTPVRQDPKAVVLDFVNPARARWRLAGRSRQAWLKAGKDCSARTWRRSSGITDIAGKIWPAARESSRCPW
jgi:hypothetical protein